MANSLFVSQFLGTKPLYTNTTFEVLVGGTGDLLRNVDGDLIISSIAVAGYGAVNLSVPGAVNVSNWYRNLDTTKSFEWHPANYYSGQPEIESSGTFGYLSKPAIILSADANGNVTSFANATGNFVITSGGTDVSASCTFTSTNPVGLVGGIDANGVYTVTAMSQDEASLDLIASYNGMTIILTLSVAKVRAGVVGFDATVYSINTSSPVLVKNAPDNITNGTFSSVNIFGRKSTGAVTTDNTGMYLTITANGDTEATSASPSPQTLNPASTSTKVVYTIKLYNSTVVSPANLLDTEVIPVVFKGATGSNGLDGLTFVLTNDNTSIPTLADGSGGNYIGSGTDIYVYEGATQLQYDGAGTTNGTFSVSASGSGVTPGSLSDGGAFCTAAACSSLTVDIAYIAFVISGKRQNGATFSATQYQTITRTKQGAVGSTGSNARTVDLISSTQAFLYDAAGTTPSPTSVSVNALSYNTIGTVYYEFLVNNVSIQNTTSANFTYSPQSSYSSMPQTLTVKIREGSNTSSVLATDIMTMFGLKPGAAGINGTRTAVLDMYKWSSSAPTTFPSGNSVLTWGDMTFSPPSENGGNDNGWTVVPGTGSAGQTLYIVNQGYADNGSSLTSTVTWNATFSVPTGTAGLSGVNGQRVGILEVFQWNIVQPSTYPTGTSTYIWSDGTFSAPSTPNGWSLTPGASVPGATLWAISCIVSNTDIAPTSIATWSSTSPYPVGAAGSDGLTCILTNESHSVPALNDGTVTDYSHSGTDIFLFEGVTPVQYDGVGTSNGTFKVTVTNNNIIAGTITDSGAQATVANSSNMTADVASISFNISGKKTNGQSFSLVKLQTITKSKQGATGANGSPGPAGTRTTSIVMYQWATTSPTVFPQGTSVFNWGSGTFTTPNIATNGWVISPGAPVSGQKLYSTSQYYSDNSTAATSSITWTTTDVSIVSYAGLDGAGASRGSGTFYASGSSWSDTTAANAVHAVYAGTLVYGDTVTISNGGTFALTKYWAGTSWVPLGQVIDGNLLVTNSVQAAAINTNGLTIRDVAGNIILNAGGGAALDFAKVFGTTKPEPNATVGADATNFKAGVGVNLLQNAGMVLGLSGWAGANVNIGLDSANWCIRAPNLVNYGTAFWGSGAYGTDTETYLLSTVVPIDPNKRYEVSAFTGAHRALVNTYIDFFDASGTYLGAGTNFSGDYVNDMEKAGGTAIAGYKRIYMFCTPPANAACGKLVVQKQKTKVGFANSYAYVTMPYLGEALALQTTPSPWSEGSGGLIEQLTPTNIGVYMASASIDTLYVKNGAITAPVVYTNNITVDLNGGAIPAASDGAHGNPITIVPNLPAPVLDVSSYRIVSLNYTFSNYTSAPGYIEVDFYMNGSIVYQAMLDVPTRLVSGNNVSTVTLVAPVLVYATVTPVFSVIMTLINGTGTSERWKQATYPQVNNITCTIATGKR